MSVLNLPTILLSLCVYFGVMHIRVADAHKTKAESRWKKAQSLYRAYV